LRNWIAANAQAAVFAVALALLAYGLWIERPSLAFIIPGGLIVLSITAIRFLSWMRSKKD
jgi:hypothetical protein